MALKEITLNSLDAAEEFVSKTPNTYWNGWNIVTFVPNGRAYIHKRGTYDRKFNRWGFTYTYPVTESGSWNVKVYVNGPK